MRLVMLLPVLMLAGCQSSPLATSAQWLHWPAVPMADRRTPAEACLAHSRLLEARAVGKTIESPHYTLITLESASNPQGMGELCIQDKVSGRIELTAVADLQFLTALPQAPVQP
jgi:hypothetical protein